MFDDKDKDLTEWFVENCTPEFFREIATFISKTLSFDIFFSFTWKMPTIIGFYDFKPSFHLETRQILKRSQTLNGFKFSC